MSPTSFLWVATVVAVVAAFGVDFLLASEKPRDPSPRECVRGLAACALAAVSFGLAVFALGGRHSGAEFLAGWLVAYSMTIEMVFVFLLIVSGVALLRRDRMRMLIATTVLALVLRSAFIVAGGPMPASVPWIFFFAGAVLLYGGGKLFDGTEKGMVAQRVFLSGEMTSSAGSPAARRLPTSLAVVAACAAVAVFAVNSVAAVSALTAQPYLLFSANAFAMLGFRQWFFLIGGLLDRAGALQLAVAVVLAFVGAKFVLESLLPHDLSGTAAVSALSVGMIFVTLVLAAAMSRVAARPRGRSATSGRAMHDDDPDAALG